MKIKLDGSKSKVLTSILTALLIAQAFCRVILSWNDGEARGLLIIWLLYTIALSTVSLFGEFMVLLRVCVWMPLVLTRCGRAAIMIFLSLMMFANEPVSAILGALVLIGAVFNVIIGWNDPPVNLEVNQNGLQTSQKAETEISSLQ